MREEYYATFLIVKEFQNSIAKRIKLFLFCLLIAGPISVFVLNKYWGDGIALTILLTSILLLFFGLIIALKLQPTYSINGNLTFRTDQITVSINDNIINIPTSELIALNFLYNGYELESDYIPAPSTITHKSGYGNILTIKTANHNFFLDIFLENPSAVKIFNNYLEYYSTFLEKKNTLFSH